MATRLQAAFLASWALSATPAWSAPIPWPPLTASGPASEVGAGDRAVIVAIEDYDKLHDVHGATLNAKEWQSWLVHTQGLPPTSVQLLTDEHATRETILAAVARAKDEVDSGATLWFVFIGHGDTVPVGSGAQARQIGMILGADARPTTESVRTRGVSHREIEAAWSFLDARAVVLFDACFSGESAAGPLRPGLMNPGRPDDAPSDWVTRLSAGTDTQYAGLLPGLGRPAFSYLVLGGVAWRLDGHLAAHDTVPLYADRTVTTSLDTVTATLEITTDGDRPLRILVNGVAHRAPGTVEVPPGAVRIEIRDHPSLPPVERVVESGAVEPLHLAPDARTGVLTIDVADWSGNDVRADVGFSCEARATRHRTWELPEGPCTVSASGRSRRVRMGAHDTRALRLVVGERPAARKAMTWTGVALAGAGVALAPTSALLYDPATTEPGPVASTLAATEILGYVLAGTGVAVTAISFVPGRAVSVAMSTGNQSTPSPPQDRLHPQPLEWIRHLPPHEQAQPERRQRRARSDHEHDQDLVGHRIEGVGAREDLARHHARQAHQADHGHGVQDRHHARAQGVAEPWKGGFPERHAQRQAPVDRSPLAVETDKQPVEAQAHPGERVAQQHAGEGDDVLGRPPPIDADHQLGGAEDHHRRRKHQRPQRRDLGPANSTGRTAHRCAGRHPGHHREHGQHEVPLVEGEDPLEDEPDEAQLQHGSHRRHRQRSRQAQLQRQVQHCGRHQEQRCHRQIHRGEGHVGHSAPR